METKRKHISFKNNKLDSKLFEWVEIQSEIYGFSSYIKKLIESDMKNSTNRGDINDSIKSRK